MRGAGQEFNARHEQDRKKMDVAIGFLDDDLRHVTRRRQHEVGMFDAVFLAVSHADDERLKGSGMKQLANARFH